PLELHAGVVSGELPVGLCMMLVAVVLPGGDFFFEGRLVWNAAAQTLARQDAEFGFGHVEPASVFGGVVPFEPFGEAARFWGGKGRVERGGRVRAQIVLDQPDLVGVGKMHVGQFLEHLRVIGGGVAVGDLDAAPALQRRENHEYIGHAVSLVFVIVPDGSSGSGRNRSARLDDQLLGGFIQTDEGAIGIARLLVSIQHVFHGGDEAGVGVRRDHPLPIAVGLEDVFFRVLPIVLSLAFSTMFNSTTFSSSRRKLQCANPSGAGEQVRAINFTSAAPSKIRGRAEFGLYLRVSAAAIPSSTSRRRVRPILLMLVSNAAEIALSLQPSPASDTSAFSSMRAFVSDCAGCLPAQIIASSCSRSFALSFTTYFLTEISRPATNHLHRRIAATEIQKNTADSMTLATSDVWPGRPCHGCAAAWQATTRLGHSGRRVRRPPDRDGAAGDQRSGRCAPAARSSRAERRK